MVSCRGTLLALVCSVVSIYLGYICNTHLIHFRIQRPFASVATIPYTLLSTSNVSIDPLVLASMKQFGFFYVNHVPNYNSSQELDYLQQFFALPDSEKMKYAVRKHNRGNRNIYRGYGPVVETSGTQYKEIFNIGPHEAEPGHNFSDDALGRLRAISRERNVWPVTQDPGFDEGFKEVFRRGFDIRRNIARSVIKSIGRSLGHPKLIERFTESEFSTLGLRKYPMRTSVNDKMFSTHDDVVLSELEHEDSTVTILATFTNPGLQALYEGVYWDVPPSRDGFIVNIGTLIEDIADKHIIAVRHRVKQINQLRYSIPFFFNPSFDADISTSISGRQTTAGKNYKIFGEWMRDYLPAVEPGLLEEGIAGL
uniref:Putative isopenicillin-n-synthase n=1 Tax=Ctenophora sp. W WRF-2014 TaxID=1567053 RepID=A0A0A0RZL5_9METZ|nr:putative isopenicillin-n-synthase [Ctenophora sp. W WRF-2014]